ncbi:MAG: M36 family metallopeptidase [Blastocatellia bacterium]
MKRNLTFLIPALFAAVAVAQSIFQPTTTPRRYEDFDIRATYQRTLDSAPLPPARTTKSAAALQPDHARLRWSSLSGTPSRMLAQQAALTARSDDEAETIARRFLRERESLFQLTAAEVDALQVTRRDQSKPSGVTHLTLQQQCNGIEVFGARMNLHLTRAGEVLAADGELMPTTATANSSLRLRVTAATALERAAATVGLQFSVLPRATMAAGAAQRQQFARSAELAREAQTRLVYFPLAADKLQLAWECEVWPAATTDAYLMVVDAERGSLLFRRNLTRYETDPHGLVFSGVSPRPDLPHTKTNPPLIERTDVPFNGQPHFVAADKHFDWWAGKPQTSLRGNNVEAHLDRNNDNLPDQPELTVPDKNFSFPLDLTKDVFTADNQKAAQVNLFYWANRFHDILYSFGFTESAGNFQTENFGLGGQGSDAIQADVQDGSGFNNANFTTPPDGRAGRVQMFVWNTSSPLLDGSLDQTVILHELTHGVSNRLIGNGLGLGGYQAAGMGEGWSDYVALALLSKETDPIDGQFMIAQYATNLPARGLRSFPYTTDINASPRTFGFIRFTREVHTVGEIWCAALWEMRAALLKQYGFQTGQRQSIQLVLDGMKFTPIEPTFLEARDAILLADRVNNNGANQCLLWQAFAKRGMGYSASTIEVNDLNTIESFDVPPFCSNTATVKLNQANYVNGEVVQIALGDRNAAQSVQVQVSSSVTADQETVTLTPDAAQPGSYKGALKIAAGKGKANDGVLQASVDSKDEIIVRYQDASNDAGKAAIVEAKAKVVREKILFADAGESDNQGWLATGAWALTTERAASGTYSWSDSPNGNYQNLSNATLTSPLFDLRDFSDIKVVFAQAYEFENRYDYGVLDYSTDDGATWNFAGAVTGTQASFTSAEVKLAGLDGQQRARFRFRLFSDLEVTGDGWYLDDIRLLGRAAEAAVIAPGSNTAPTITSVSPAYGALSGGTRVTVTGANFTDSVDTIVTFDGIAASNLKVISDSTLIAVTPQHAAGAVAVRVLNRNGGSSFNQGFTYWSGESLLKRPTITRVTPNSGSVRGGTVVTITGKDFTPATTLVFGNKLVTPTFISPQELRVTSPSSATTGVVRFVISNGNFSDAWEDAFTYTAATPPQVQLLSPNGGEVLYAGSTTTIRWRSSDDRAVIKHRLALVSSSGALLTEIAGDVSGERQAFVWTLPSSLPAGTARLRITAIDDESAETQATSAQDFTIVKRWQTGTPLPTALWQFPAVTDGQSIYTLGGLTGAAGTTVNTLARFEPGNNTWTTLAPMKRTVSSNDAVYLNGKIYVPGGMLSSGLVITNHQVYDLATNAWKEVLEPPTSVIYSTLVADTAQNRYYRIGGRNANNSSAISPELFVYDVKANEWTELSPLPEARYGHEAVFINGRIFVAGGADRSTGLRTCWQYDPATDFWTPFASLNKKRRFAASALGSDAQGNPLWFLLGGDDPDTGAPLPDGEVYDVRNDRWLPLDDSFRLSKGRTQMASVTLNGKLYAMGGAVLSDDGKAYVISSAVESIPVNNTTLTTPDQPPVLAAPTAAVAIVGNESTLVVTANDLHSSIALSLKAEGLPAGASFTVTTETNNSTRGLVRWTPQFADAGKTWTVIFTASDGQLEDSRVVTLRAVTADSLAVVNAASYAGGAVAADSIATAFGVNLAARAEAAQAIPLPLTMAGASVTVNGVPTPLLYVSPEQINFVLPPHLAPGIATVLVSNAQGTYALGYIPITDDAPALFTADATGRGDAAAVATADGAQYQTSPFPLTVNGKPNYLLLFGTGLRHAAAANAEDENGIAESVTVTIGGIAAKVLYAGAQGQYLGLDQLNIELPARLAAQLTTLPSRVEIVVSVNGHEANRASLWLKKEP